MDIAAGYKMTEVGIIPEDWEIIPIKDLAREMTDGPFGSDLKREHYTEEKEVRIIQLSNVGESGWQNENTKYTTFSHAQELKRCIVEPGSIVVAKMMPAGRAILCPSEEKQYIQGSDVVNIIPNDKIDPLYFVYATKTKSYLEQIDINTQGSTRARTSISKLKKIQFIVPPIDEQKKIATVLSSIDDFVKEINKKISKKKKIKEGTMQQLLTGKKRLPGFDGDWMCKTIGECCNLFGRIGFRGYTKQDLVRKHEGAITFSPSNIYEQVLDISNCDYISLAKYEESPEIKVYNGDILFCKTASIGKCAIVRGLEEKATINPQFVVLKDFKCNNYFLYYVIAFTDFQDKVKSITGGSTIPTMSQEKLKLQKIMLPPSQEEQKAIATILSDMDMEIQALEDERDKYLLIKQGMMQDLLAGKTRLV